ncbi:MULTISPECIES: SulP family inorganic anion transporter [unclassified Arenibacter]|uniref:SulP family inorganic anion transporter n=1 Tax=unclassified Arenibacter TaxID=2615047 RepID=UPI000E357AAE|nr:MULTISPECIES: SulP family inorganic anion transporter [unclassified Arenibacter]MCM4164798.1 sodium-independent anion transporter [Arenibacter sp. A80]RFT55219.1 STAS domain-containing protein [Arenibacter sp. P308M17]
MKNKEFTPKFITLIKEGISRKQLTKDVLSGIIVGIVALPLAIAFAIASGVSPEKGLITAIIAGFVISILSGSRVQIGGPTGAFIIIVFGIVQEHGVSGLTIATFMAGFLIIGLGVLKLGNYLKFIPYPLIVGFTSGIAVVIFSTQIKDFLGMDIDNIPADFVEKWLVYFQHLDSINWMAFTIAIGTVLIALYFYRITTKIPGSLVAILLATLLVYFFELPVETIESKFGEIPNKIALPQIPNINFKIIQQLIEPAIAIALLGAIESLLSAVVADGMIGGKHRSNMELVAQGVGNIFSGLFGGIPATGAIARTATNVKNGGRTPIAGIVHAIFLLLIMLLFAPIAKLIPLSCLAGILVVVAYHMSEWRHFKDLLKSNRMDIIVLLTTFFLTVFFDLILAIEIGLILSSFIFMKRMSEATTINNAENLFGAAESNGEKLFEEELPYIPKNTMLYEINGPLFFGASQKFQEFLTDLKQEPKVLILRMRNVPFIDATAVNRLKEFHQKLKSCGTTIIISGANRQVKEELFKSEFYSLIGKNNILDNINQAIERAEKINKE